MNQWDKKSPKVAKNARPDTTGKMMGPDQLTLFSSLPNESPQIGQDEVRQPQQAYVASAGSDASPPPPAHPSERLLIQLNPRWRVIDDDLQYLLQRRKGTSRSKATGWTCHSFCRTRDALLRCIREYCGSMEDHALEQVRALPDWHIDR
jgi:hypothetical protein